MLSELCYLLSKRLGAEAEALFVRSILRGEFLLEPFDEQDLDRIADLLARYANLRVGFVDASIVAIAERLDITTILTTDRRHFGVVRPVHVPHLTLAP